MPYKFQTVSVPGATDGTKLGGINNAGVVAGSDAGFGYDHYNHAFTYANGQISPFTLTEYKPNTTANGINSEGKVVGLHGTDPTGETGYIWSPDGSERFISNNPTHVSGVHDLAFGINDHGQVVGTHVVLGLQQHLGYLWQNGSMSLFQAPGASATEGHGINNAGVIVGSADNHGFMDAGGHFSKIAIPGATVTDPMAINNNGKIVGSYNDGTHWHGFIDTNGTMTFINVPGAADTWLTGVNDNGTLVGYSDTASGGPTQGFIARDPVRTMVREDYVGLLGHDADPATQAFWANLLKTGGLTPRDFANALTQSAEAQAQHGHQTGKQFVNSVYENAHQHQCQYLGILRRSGTDRPDRHRVGRSGRRLPPVRRRHRLGAHAGRRGSGLGGYVPRPVERHVWRALAIRARGEVLLLYR
jgi:probable HAF family extracellular repeat protein